MSDLIDFHQAMEISGYCEHVLRRKLIGTQSYPHPQHKNKRLWNREDIPVRVYKKRINKIHAEIS